MSVRPKEEDVNDVCYGDACLETNSNSVCISDQKLEREGEGGVRQLIQMWTHQEGEKRGPGD